MAEPGQPALSQQREHRGEASACEDLNVWHFVAPLDVGDAVEAARVETVQSLLLLCVGCPCLAAVQQSADNAGIVYGYLGRNCELGVLPDTCGEPTKCCCGLPDTLLDLSIEG